MADLTVTQLSAITSAASADEIPIWQASSAQQKKITVANLVGTALTGTGTNGRIAEWGGASTLQASSLAKTGAGLLTLDAPISRTLTVAVTGTAAVLEVANTFTAGQVVSGTSGTATLGNSSLVIANQAAGAGNRGGYASIGKNSDDGAPGHVVCVSGNAGVNNAFLWPDDTGVWRTLQGGSTAWPTAANRNSGGTVVGAQSSSKDVKTLRSRKPDNVDDVAERVREGAKAVRRFVYKSGAFGSEEFHGVVVDYAPDYGMDRDEAHPAGKSLNEINILGDLLVLVNDLVARVEALEAA